MQYNWTSPTQIVFGWGRRQELDALVADVGRRAFVVLGSRSLERNGTWTEIDERLRRAGVRSVLAAAISHEPEVDDVDGLAHFLRHQGLQPGDFLLAIGGGSAIDLAKAAAAVATNVQTDTVKDFLEGVGRGLRVTETPLPLVALPTTGGTGTECTKNAVISSFEPVPFKKSIRSPQMVARLVVVDPQLTITVPPRITAYTGLDAITQLIESAISKNSWSLPQALAAQGLKGALEMLPTAVRDGASRPAREALAHAAMLSGLTLANAGLGLAHGVAAALGAICRVPHGLACAVMLPTAIRVNRGVCEPMLAALSREALSLGAKPNDQACVDALEDRIDALCAELAIPVKLSELGVRSDQLPELVAGSHGNSLNGNPRPLDDTELYDLLGGLL